MEAFLMSGVSFEISMAGLESVGALLNEFVRSASDLKPALKSIGEHIVSEARLNFANERGPDGRAWKMSLRARKEKGQTLSLTARLRNSISYRVRDDSVSVGTNVIYAAVHQLGLSGNVTVSAHERRIVQAFGKKLKKPRTITVKSHVSKRNIPARPFLPMTLEEVGVSEIEQILIRHLLRSQVNNA